MTLTVAELWETGVLSLRDPRKGAQRVLDWRLPKKAIGPFVGLSAIASTLSAEISSMMNPLPDGAQGTYVNTLHLPLIFAATLAVMAWSIVSIGRRFGGTGGFQNTILLLSWQQVLSSAGILAFTVIGLFSTAMAMAVFLAFGLYLIWVTANFTAVVHGFPKIGAPLFITIAGLLIGAAFNLFLLNLFGVSFVQGELS